MVNNRQDEMRRVESLWGGEATDNGISILPEDFYRRDLYSDTSRIFSEHSYNIFMGNNNSTDELDAGTSDSSEADLLWQFNQSSKISSTTSTTIESKPKKPVSKPIRSPQFRNSNTVSRPSANGPRGTKQFGPADMKRKASVRR